VHRVGSCYTDTSPRCRVLCIVEFLNIYRTIGYFLLENLMKNGRNVFQILGIKWMPPNKTLVDFFFKNPYKYHGSGCNVLALLLKSPNISTYLLYSFPRKFFSSPLFAPVSFLFAYPFYHPYSFQSSAVRNPHEIRTILSFPCFIFHVEI